MNDIAEERAHPVVEQRKVTKVQPFLCNNIKGLNNLKPLNDVRILIRLNICSFGCVPIILKWINSFNIEMTIVFFLPF